MVPPKDRPTRFYPNRDLNAVKTVENKIQKQHSFSEKQRGRSQWRQPLGYRVIVLPGVPASGWGRLRVTV